MRVEIFLGTLGDEPVLSEPLGTFKPGQSKPAVIKNDLLVHAQMMERVMFKGERRVAQVWWMSPLGEPETYDIYERS
ncbi:hypothetical protein AUL38_04110 [Leucobacter sp. G161]|nr:hypothetical protein AUL38_04110 [Leucobacter sp. G161]